MAEYDLGTAHGRIVIRSDNRGAGEAARALVALQSTIANLNRTMSGIERSLDSFARGTTNAAQAARNADGSLRTTTGTISRMAGVATNTAAQIQALAQQMAAMGQTAVQTGIQLDNLHGIMEKFSSVPNILQAVAGGFGGIDDEINALPTWQRNIVNLNRSIMGYRAAGGVLAGFANRIGAVVAGTAAFGFMASKFSTVRHAAQLMGSMLLSTFPVLNHVRTAFQSLGTSMGVAANRTGEFAAGATRAVRGASQLVTAGVLARKALEGIGRAAKIATLGLTGVAAAGGALKALGTFILGVANAAKQMSGAFLILPGVIAQLGIAGGVAKLGFNRLTEAIKAAGETGAKFDEAIKELSPTMQAVAKEAQKFAVRVKGLRDIAADQMFAGLADDIKNFGNVILPIAEFGVAQVARSLNSLKNAFRDFIIQPQTLKDMNEAFALTGVTINNVSRGVKPMLNAFRDIGIEGMKAFTGLTGGIGLAAKQFELFIANARKTGQIQEWIREGIQGFKDFGVAVAEFSRGFAAIFRAFGSDGTNALERMRASAEKFNKTMQESGKTGSLRTIAEALERMSSAGLDALKAALQQIARVMETIAPFAERLSTAFSTGLVSAIQAIGSAANTLAAALSKFSFIGELVGTMLAFGVAIKGIMLVMIPVTKAAQLMGAAFLALRGITNVVGGVNGAMGALGRSTTVASAAMTGLRAAGSAVLSFMGGPLGVAIMAVVAAMYSLKAASDATAKAQSQYRTNAQHAAEANGLLIESFEKAGGVMNGDVFDQLISNIRTLRQDLEETAQTSTGFFADLGAAFKDYFSGKSEGLAGEEIADSNEAMNRSIDETARKAREASNALKDLGVTDTQIAAAVSGTQGDWDAFVARLGSLGDEGREAVTALTPMRAAFTGIQESMTRMGPESVALSEAFQTLANASSSASDKLAAMRSALQALGILETSATEAAFQLTQTIAEVGEAASGSLGPANELGQALLNGQGGFNTTNASAKLLHDELKKLGDALLETAASGGDVNGAYGQMQGALNALAAQAGLSRTEIDALARTVGVAPDVLNILVNLKGATEAQAELQAVLLEASKAQGANFTITAQAKTEEARAALSALGFQVQLVNSQTGEVKITGNTADAQSKLQAILLAAQQVGSQRPNVPVGTNAPIIAGQFNALQGAILGLPPSASVPVTTPGTGEAKTELGLINSMLLGLPPVVQLPVQAPGAPAVGQAVQEIQGAVTQLPPGVNIPTTAPGATETAGSLTELFSIISGLPPAGVNVPVASPGLPEANAGFNEFNGKLGEAQNAITNFQTSMQGAMTAVGSAISSMVSTATTQLQGLGSAANASGAALGQGFADGIRSKVGAVRQAALELAQAAAEPLPRSPAKIGPFSGRGWTPYRGASLALGFGEGITDSIPTVRGQVLDFASAVSTAMDMVRSAFNYTPTSFDANRVPGASGSRFYRDPTKTDADLATARAEKAKAKAEEEALDARFAETDAAKEAAKEASRERSTSSKANKEAIGSMEELAERFNVTITSNKRDEPGSFHNTGEAFDFAGSPEDMKRLNAYLAKNDPAARELFYDPGVNIDEGQQTGAIGGHSDHVHYVPSLSKPTEQAIQDTANNTSKATSSQSDIVDAIVAEGKRRGLSDEDIAAGVATGLVESNLQDLPDIPNSEFDSEGVFQQRPSMGWGDASDSVAKDAQDFFDAYEKTDQSLSPGERAQAVQRSAFPDKYGQRMAEAMELTQQSLARQGSSIDTGLATTSDLTAESQTTQEDMLDELRQSNSYLGEQIRIAENPSSSDADVIRALQSIDDEIATTNDRDIYEGLIEVRDAVMEDRGIEKYDPFEGASTDVFGDVLSLAQGVVGLFDTIKDGLDGLTSVSSMLVRGISNTGELSALVDGMQSVLSSVGEVISTVSSIVEIGAKLAALAGFAIPGVGQIAAVASVLTGGIGNINAIVDLVQEVFDIGGWIVGNLLSTFLGGAEGPLSGNVHMLLDRNDNTIKSWSDANPDDKRVRSIGPNNNTNTTNNQQNLAIYAGPGTDPYQMMGEAMYAIRASNAGVY
ncbi:tape measure protein [Nocardia phage P3.1]|nr:tape measure protein [Nocardia phage P3.1]